MFCRLIRPFRGGRRVQHSLLLLVAGSLLGGMLLYRWLDRAGDVLRAQSRHGELLHLRGSRSLHDYLDGIREPLIEPSSVACSAEATPVLALVSSSPGRQRHRQAVRDSWGRQLNAYFFLGLQHPEYDGMLVDNYVEAKQHSDLVVFDFKDAYHNLTLKTALMLQWAIRRCPNAEFVMKTDDDVFVNPWTLKRLVQEHAEDQLVGYRITNSAPDRNPYNKWGRNHLFLPRWLYTHDSIPEYLSGALYLIKGEYVPKIYAAAFDVPLINLENIFFTYLVSRQTLGLELTHDARISPWKPLFPVDCSYWHFASLHSLDPSEIVSVWSQIESIANDYENGQPVCGLYERYFNSFSSNALLY